MGPVASVELARALRDLHRPGDPLVLANVWDASSAALVEAAGFKAVATSSAAVAEALGYSDREQAPVEEMLWMTERIVANVSVPVSVDFEAGYGLEPDELVRRLLATGAVGCNLEDTDHRAGALLDAARQSERLAAVRAAADRAAVPLVINARTDVFIHGHAADEAEEGELLDAALSRSRAYLDAGADCVYPILIRHRRTIESFINEIPGCAVNVLCSPGGLTPAEAAALGAARVSLGPGLWRAVQAGLRERLDALASGGSPY